MSDPFSLHIAKVYLKEAQSTKFFGWKLYLLSCVAKRRLDYLEYLRSKNKVQLELF